MEHPVSDVNGFDEENKNGVELITVVLVFNDVEELGQAGEDDKIGQTDGLDAEVGQLGETDKVFKADDVDDGVSLFVALCAADAVFDTVELDPLRDEDGVVEGLAVAVLVTDGVFDAAVEFDQLGDDDGVIDLDSVIVHDSRLLGLLDSAVLAIAELEIEGVDVVVHGIHRESSYFGGTSNKFSCNSGKG
eukprot:gb/GECG01014951.1/.p1 GENE.gb/GECG01014951.1/~~gb/GECG01014951.1/.p1  ORF type:complete len:190 (+),score=36.49 gb/GECG01014951.1/:1-570(+)